MTKSTFIIVVILSFSISFPFQRLNSQNVELLKEMRDSLQSKSFALYQIRDDEERLELNKEISKLVLKAIKQEKSILYPFDSVKYISILTSEDKRLRVFTWVLPNNDGTFECFGYMQTYDEQNSDYRSWELKDKSAEIVKPESKILSPDKWYGALYYEMIFNKYKGKKFYTLLGWDANDRISKKKVIEIVTLKKNGEPIFGFSLFNAKELKYVKDPNGKRIIFEYSAQAKMHLDYEQHFVHEKIVSDKKPSKTKKTKGFGTVNKDIKPAPKEKVFESKLIIFDRLAANNKELEGVFQFYFPETNVMDGFVFTKGKWKYYQEIDARNPPSGGGKKTVKKQINYNLF